ncbi:MAG: response regulator, partial [Planctomycetota bacterium]
CQAVHIGAGGDTLARLRRGIELPNTEVRAILPGRDGRLWFATYGSGFVGLGPGATRAVAAAEGLPDPYLCGVVPTASGWLVGTNRGPLLVDPATLDDCADGRRRTIVCRQLQCTGNVATEANGGVAPSAAVAGGHAAMCAIGGLHVVDLDRLRAPLPPPVCHLEPLLAGDQRLEHGPDIDVVHLTSDRTLVLACSAPDFDRPEALFYRWRLRGGEWSEAKARRSLTVPLPGPGDFDIEVEAIGNGERRSEEPTRLGVRVAAQPWEQPWLRLVAAIALVAFVAAGFRFGARRAAQQAKHLQVLVDERTHEIASARDLLEQRVEQRTLELEQALARLATDHEQRSLLERELEQMQRMESLGQLAGSVAHDFNNLLTVVLGNVDLLQGEIAPHDSRHELTRHIREAATRGREITQRLLAVASRQTVVPHVLDLAELLRAHLGVLRDLMGNSILVQLEVTGEPLHLTASPGQIDQILMNLAVNARDAMPRGGVLRLSASGSGAYVHLAVRDTGSGMAKEVRDRAFEPFFTTKKERGTGLGLATVYGITKQLQGEVTIDSAPGEGTGFLFTFPRASEPVEAPVVVPRAPVGRSEARILLIEDEPEVRRALRLLLEKSGYRVVGEAAGGAAGMHWLAEGGAAIDVVVSDVRMPGLHGIELVHALRGVRAGLPILFLSGHSSSARLLTELAPLGIEMITKPPTREELVAAIERALAVLPPAAG